MIVHIPSDDFLNENADPIRVPYPSLHFGYAGKTRFHTFGTWERCLRLWAANPERSADGTWKDNEGGILIMLRLKKDVKERFDSLLEKELKELEEINSVGNNIMAEGALSASAKL